MSIFFIWSIACMTRPAFTGSGSAIISIRATGMTCHDAIFVTLDTLTATACAVFHNLSATLGPALT